MRILFLNPQGNFDHNDSYWTEHPDFGGQLVYVKEIASSLAELGHEIDIVTRQFDDNEFPEFKDQIDYYQSENPRIVRIPCGPNKFVQKEELWGHLEEWVHNIIQFYQQENTKIDFITGHYADGGFAAYLMKKELNIKYSFTGHSLGAQKLEKLLRKNSDFESLDQTFHFRQRLNAERIAMENADVIFTSTSQERDQQYSHKLYIDISDFFIYPLKFHVAPAGANTTVFAPVNQQQKGVEWDKLIEATKTFIAEDRRSLPYIILASRLDAKKNHIGLVEAYAASKELQDKANILISLRGIKNPYEDISNASLEEQRLLQEIMDVVNQSNLVDHLAFIDIASQKELAKLYQETSLLQSVFCLPALYEPFGLAPIEAMAAGLAAAVTMYGGPKDVLEEDGERYGVLLDIHDPLKIVNGILEVLENYSYYQSQGRKRVLSKYTWMATAKAYEQEMMRVLNSDEPSSKENNQENKSLEEVIQEFLKERGEF